MMNKKVAPMVGLLMTLPMGCRNLSQLQIQSQVPEKGTAPLTATQNNPAPSPSVQQDYHAFLRENPLRHNSKLKFLGRGDSPALRPDGKKVAMARNGKGRTIWVIDLESGNQQLLTSPSQYDAPKWSPDGQQIIYTEIRGERNNQRLSSIWIMGAQGEHPRQVTSGHNDTNPSWSPDGKYIVWQRGGGGANSQLWIADTNGKNARPLSEKGIGWGKSARLIHWGPSGQELFYSVEDLSKTAKDPSRSKIIQVTLDSFQQKAIDAKFLEDRNQFMTKRGTVYICGGSEIQKIKSNPRQQSLLLQVQPGYIENCQLSPDQTMLVFNTVYKGERHNNVLALKLAD
jgi:Tol biopolymer transport system component